MKTQIKLALPYYYVVLVCMFTLCLPIIRHVTMCNEIGGMIDRNFAFLSIIIFSNTYFVEIQLHTAEIFYLVPGSGALIDLYKKIVVKGVFLVLFMIITYALYLLGKPHILAEETLRKLFLEALFATSSSIFFWGMLSYSFVNFTFNLWIGLSATIVIWYLVNSTIGQKLPIFMNMFAYGHLDYLGNQIPNWYISKIVGVIVGIFLLLLNGVLIKRSPCR